MNKFFKGFIILVLVLSLTGFLLAGCGDSEAEQDGDISINGEATDSDDLADEITQAIMGEDEESAAAEDALPPEEVVKAFIQVANESTADDSVVGIESKKTEEYTNSWPVISALELNIYDYVSVEIVDSDQSGNNAVVNTILTKTSTEKIEEKEHVFRLQVEEVMVSTRGQWMITSLEEGTGELY